jgi:hypothetical protein
MPFRTGISPDVVLALAGGLCSEGATMAASTAKSDGVKELPKSQCPNLSFNRNRAVRNMQSARYSTRLTSFVQLDSEKCPGRPMHWAVFRRRQAPAGAAGFRLQRLPPHCK